MTTTDNQQVLSSYAREHIEKWVQRYPKEQRQSGVFEALRVVQEENGYLTEELMNAVADFLKMPHIAVYEVATFYELYFTKPVGKHVIELCTNISCMLNGSDKILQQIRERLKIDLNETTEDGMFTLREIECLGACINAPVCMVGKKYYEHLTPERVDEMLDALRRD